MLMISPAASAAIETVLAAPEVPEGAGLRLATAGHTERGVAIALHIAERPAPDDEVVESAGGTGVFLDPQAAGLLGDQILDAEFEGDRVAFSIHPYPVNGNRRLE